MAAIEATQDNTRDGIQIRAGTEPVSIGVYDADIRKTNRFMPRKTEVWQHIIDQRERTALWRKDIWSYMWMNSYSEEIRNQFDSFFDAHATHVVASANTALDTSTNSEFASSAAFVKFMANLKKNAEFGNIQFYKQWRVQAELWYASFYFEADALKLLSTTVLAIALVELKKTLTDESATAGGDQDSVILDEAAIANLIADEKANVLELQEIKQRMSQNLEAPEPHATLVAALRSHREGFTDTRLENIIKAHTDDRRKTDAIIQSTIAVFREQFPKDAVKIARSSDSDFYDNRNFNLLKQPLFTLRRHLQKGFTMPLSARQTMDREASRGSTDALLSETGNTPMWNKPPVAVQPGPRARDRTHGRVATRAPSTRQNAEHAAAEDRHRATQQRNERIRDENMDMYDGYKRAVHLVRDARYYKPVSDDAGDNATETTHSLPVSITFGPSPEQDVSLFACPLKCLLNRLDQRTPDNSVPGWHIHSFVNRCSRVAFTKFDEREKQRALNGTTSGAGGIMTQPWLTETPRWSTFSQQIPADAVRVLTMTDVITAAITEMQRNFWMSDDAFDEFLNTKRTLQFVHVGITPRAMSMWRHNPDVVTVVSTVEEYRRIMSFGHASADLEVPTDMARADLKWHNMTAIDERKLIIFKDITDPVNVVDPEMGLTTTHHHTEDAIRYAVKHRSESALLVGGETERFLSEAHHRTVTFADINDFLTKLMKDVLQLTEREHSVVHVQLKRELGETQSFAHSTRQFVRDRVFEWQPGNPRLDKHERPVLPNKFKDDRQLDAACADRSMPAKQSDDSYRELFDLYMRDFMQKLNPGEKVRVDLGENGFMNNDLCTAYVKSLPPPPWYKNIAETYTSEGSGPTPDAMKKRGTLVFEFFAGRPFFTVEPPLVEAETGQ